MSNRQSLRERLACLLTLERGWHYGEGEPVPLAAAVWVSQWLSCDDENFDEWLMFPMVTGGVELERQVQQGSLLIMDNVKVCADRIVHFRGTMRENLQWLWSGYWEHSLLTPHECLDYDVKPL